jgi:hypothetical protein
MGKFRKLFQVLKWTDSGDPFVTSVSCTDPPDNFSAHVSKSLPSGASFAMWPTTGVLDFDCAQAALSMSSIRSMPSPFLPFTCKIISALTASCAAFLRVPMRFAFFWLHKKCTAPTGVSASA